MNATAKNIQTAPADEEVEPTPANTDAALDTGVAVATGLTPRQQASALHSAQQAVAADSAGASGGGNDFTGTFAAAPPTPGEFRLPLSKLGEWAYHLRAGSREKSAHFEALSLTAAEPDDLRPLVVLPEVDGVHPIFDGRFTWYALKAMHPGDEDVMIRCVRYAGTEPDAVAAMCDTALGTIEASPMEKVQALLNVQQVNGISQRAIVERYPRLTKDKVSNMLIAARMREAYPVLFDILVEPDLAPISYGTTILTLRKDLPPETFEAMLERAEDIAGNGERLTPKEALAALEADGDTEEPIPEKPTKPKPVVPVRRPTGSSVMRATAS